MAQCFQSVDLSWPGMVGLFFMVMVLLMNAIAFGTNHWGIIDPLIQDPPFTEGYMGVLEYCKDSRCEKYVDDDFLDTKVDVGCTQMTRASATMTMISMLLTFLALLQVAFSLGRKGQASIIYDVAVMNVLSGICSIVSFSVFASMLRELSTTVNLEGTYDLSTGYSFNLSVTSFVFAWIAAAIFFLETKSLVYMEVDNVRHGGRGLL